MEDQLNLWRPDWTDESKYPDDKATPEEWAWEFVRRNPEYQKDYFDLNRDLPSPKEQKDDWAKYEPINIAIKKHFSQKFGVSYARHPAHKYKKLLKFERQNLIITEAKIAKYKMNYGEVLASIDLLKPIKPQLQKLEIELENQVVIFCKIYNPPKNDKRLQVKKYKNYLRILDAKYSKVNNDHIASILYPYIENEYPDHKARDKVKSDYKAARKLQKSDYFFLC